MSAPLLPNPVITSRGRVMCNAPLLYRGQPVGYCSILVNPEGTRLRRPRWHRGPHRIEWGGA